MIRISPAGHNLNLRSLFFLTILRFNVYPLLGAGWSSNSKYSVIGRLRAMAQTIAYEIRLAFLILSVLLVRFNVDLLGRAYPFSLISIIIFSVPVFLI